MANANFGKTIPSQSVDPKVLAGWGSRLYNWEFATSVQHQIVPRVSVDAGYFRRWYGNFLVTDNRALAASDFDRFTLQAPSDPRLPNGGGYTISGLYNLNPSKFGVPADNFITFAKNYGKQIEHWNGVDLSLNSRLGKDLMLQGGISTGRTSTDNCEVAAKLPESLTTLFGPAPLSYCHIDTLFLTQVKALGSYTIPKVDFQVSAALQSSPGPQSSFVTNGAFGLSSQYTASSAQVAPSLGRPLSGGLPNVTVNIVKPGSMYGERMTQLDLRFGKLLKYARTRTMVSLDVYNALNSNAVLEESPFYFIWRQPQVVLMGRFMKISAQFDF
jgi:hypothetical protein